MDQNSNKYREFQRLPQHPPLLSWSPLIHQSRSTDMGVSIVTGVPLVIIHFWLGIFPYKPSSYGGTPIYGNLQLGTPMLKKPADSVPRRLKMEAPWAQWGGVPGSSRSIMALVSHIYIYIYIHINTIQYLCLYSMYTPSWGVFRGSSQDSSHSHAAVQLAMGVPPQLAGCLTENPIEIHDLIDLGLPPNHRKPPF